MARPSTPPTLGTVPRKTRIGSALRTLRVERGLLVRELAEKSGVSRWTITNIENGHVRAEDVTLSKLARGLGVSLSTFEGEA